MLRVLAMAPLSFRLGEPVDVRTEAAELFAAYTTTAPAELHSRARRLTLRTMREWESSLAEVAVDVACLAALTGYTSGRRRAGFQFSGMAESLAVNTGQSELIARAAGVKAVFYSAEMGIGQPDKAATLHQYAAEHGNPGVLRAWALANLAPELAAINQRQDALRALDEADHQWARGWGHGFFSVTGFLESYSSPAPIVGMTGRTLAVLGDHRAALTELGAALSLPGSPRLTAVWYIDCVLAYLAGGDCDQTCSAAMTALNACEETGYGLGLDRVRSIRARFPKYWQGTTSLQALDDYLTLL